MKNRLCTTVFAAMLALSASESIHAGSIDTVGVMTEQTNSYAPIDHIPGAMRSFAVVEAAAPLGNFTHAFSTLGETQWNITWQAPAGGYIEIAVPTGFERFQVNMQFAAGSFGNPGGTGSFVPSTVVLVPGSPALPLNDEQVSLTGPGGENATASGVMDDGGFATVLIPGETYQFTSISFSYTIPDTYDVDLDSPVNNFFIQGIASFSGPGSAPADPGQWVSVVVPEPSSLALLGLGGLLVSRRRRSAAGL